TPLGRPLQDSDTDREPDSLTTDTVAPVPIVPEGQFQTVGSNGKQSKPFATPSPSVSMVVLKRSALFMLVVCPPANNTVTELFGPAKSLTQRKRPFGWSE